MANFPYSLDFLNASPHHLGTRKELHWLVSVFSGIILCKIVYDLTGLVSSLCFKGYEKLSDAVRVEWNNRGFSTFHAIFVSVASLYLLLLSDLFSVSSEDDLFINRTSKLSETVFGISIGYFLTDLAMIFWNFPALGGFEYVSTELHSLRPKGSVLFGKTAYIKVIHHGLSMYSILLSLTSGQAQFYILMTLFTEVTTPFVNLRWYLDAAGKKSSKLYVYNGIAMFLGWLVARVLLFIYSFSHMAIHFDQVKKVFPLGFYSLLAVPPALAIMNAFWFWKISKGLIKTLTKARHSK